METRLAEFIKDTPEGREADAILRACVHCGFCNATCPTYQLLGDELDGPRGRIYLMKQALEGHTPTRVTELHLDRCLTCLNCATTCPSGRRSRSRGVISTPGGRISRPVRKRSSSRRAPAACTSKTTGVTCATIRRTRAKPRASRPAPVTCVKLSPRRIFPRWRRRRKRGS